MLLASSRCVAENILPHRFNHTIKPATKMSRAK